MNSVKDIFSKEILIDKSLCGLSESFKKLPSFVSDYLIAKLVDPDNTAPGILKISNILDENFVDSNKKELIKSRIKEIGRYNLLGHVLARLDESKNEYFATINALDDNNIRITTEVLEKFGDSLLSTGLFGNILVYFDPHTKIKNKNYPFVIAGFTPFQINEINLDSYIQKRSLFSTDEWIDFIVNSIGLNPDKLSYRQKLIYLCRLIPFVESNVNMIELGPVATSKTHFYRNVSQYGLVLSGSSVSVANLFYNKLRRSPGIVCLKDLVVFDEISGVKFNDGELTNMLKDFMNSGKFSRDKIEMSSECGVVFIGNIDTDINKMEPKNYYKHLFIPLPVKIREDRAFLDRLHGFIPGWELAKISMSCLSCSYGLQTDYLSEIVHKFRNKNYSYIIKSKIKFNEIGFRDQNAVTKLASGLLKIICPHKDDKTINNEELKLVMDLSCELRQRVVDQLKIILPSEFSGAKIGYEIN